MTLQSLIHDNFKWHFSTPLLIFFLISFFLFSMWISNLSQNYVLWCIISWSLQNFLNSQVNSLEVHTILPVKRSKEHFYLHIINLRQAPVPKYLGCKGWYILSTLWFFQSFSFPGNSETWWFTLRSDRVQKARDRKVGSIWYSS